MKDNRIQQLTKLGMQVSIPGFEMAIQLLVEALEELKQNVGMKIDRQAVLVKKKQGRPKKQQPLEDLISSVPAPKKRPMTKEARAHLSEVRKQYWANLTTRKRNALKKKLRLGKEAKAAAA